MADSKISALTAVGTPAGTDEFAVNQSAASKRMTLTQVATFTGTAIAAAQSDQETATSVALAVTPGRQQYHPSAAKFWVNATGNSTTMVASYNMASWANTGAGDADGTIATDFSSANWCGVVTILDSTLAWDATYTEAAGLNAMAAGTFGVLCSRMQDGGTAAATLQHPDSWHVAGFGDQ